MPRSPSPPTTSPPETKPAADAPADDTKPADDKPAKQPKAPPAAPVGAPFAAYTLPEHPRRPRKPSSRQTPPSGHSPTREFIENGLGPHLRTARSRTSALDGQSRRYYDAEVIDCQGKHITPGLIDAHSHTGLFRLGVNESGQAVTAEVRIADSLDPGHINFYRQLAGGLTAANLLHGSANPIGGQSQTVKLRWGALRPSDMFFEDAKPGIKFALGENVKQSNWGDENTTRYPQTRLGVETLIRDRFTKAREYAADRGQYDEAMKKLHSQMKATVEGIKEKSTDTTKVDASYKVTIKNPELIPPRDLELEILAQILAGERLVHSHSYRQDEILMLCRVAEDFGFKIGTFQHGLETYKVAEVVREHAIGASLFSDWWAYKVEVQDAIPYAGPINFEAGLLTSYNSDSDDLARRMNVEAGKALRYARASGIDMSPQDALAFVTTNPAIQLGIEHRVGTIEPGKDADIAVWSGDPLSSLTRCERTFVDGIQLFSIEQDAAHRQRMQTERARLINEIMAEGRPDPKPKKDEQKPSEGSEPPTRRSLLAAAYERAMNEHIDHGPRPGDCGCNLLPRELLRLND
jgi:imidazolonepropionase-like amidohydrolase